jgi:hypothetical protein
MTAIGKIFVIINLLFSVVVAGFIVIVYARSTNWYAAQKKWEEAAKIADASRASSEKELEQVRAEASESARELKKKDDQIVALNGRIKAIEADAQTKLTEVKKGSNAEQFSIASMRTELEKREAEVKSLEKQVKDKDEAIVKYIDLKNKANDAKVAAEIKADSYQAKAERLELRIRETEMDLVKLRRSGSGGSGGAALVSTKESNPPPQSVEGIVTETTQRGDLVRISIGSDAGLEKGHTLDVFRLKPTPLYLGQIRLTDVRAADAVGQPVDKLKFPAQKGDMVASDVAAKK